MKPFVLTTCVWGDQHLDAMTHSMWPTMVAAGNLPTLANLYRVTYRVSTTHQDRRRLQDHPLVVAMRRYAEVEFVVATDEAAPDPRHHVEWYHRATAEARDRGALIAFLPPDVAWSSVTIGNLGRRMAEGFAGLAMPYIRVLSETVLPALKAMPRTDDLALDISPRELMRLGLEHWHPLSALATAASPHGRPSLEKLWRVPGEGFLLRQMVRELSAFDPSRIAVTHLWYAGEGTMPEQIHIVDDSDEMMMLSFAPMGKDIPIYLQDHRIDAFDIAKQSLHPWNDTPLNPWFALQSVRLHYAPMTPGRWRRAEQRADSTFRQARVARSVMQLWTALKNRGDCDISARLMASGLYATPLARRWRSEEPLTIFVPTDAAYRNSRPWHLLDPARPNRLWRWLQAHVASGDAAALSSANDAPYEGPVVDTLAVAGNSVVLIPELRTAIPSP